MEPSTFEAIEVLGNRTRFHIVLSLYKHDMSATDFIDTCEISIPAIMKHLKILEDIGLITRKKIGRRNMCSLNKQMFHTLNGWQDLLEVSWLDMLILSSR